VCIQLWINNLKQRTTQKLIGARRASKLDKKTLSHSVDPAVENKMQSVKPLIDSIKHFTTYGIKLDLPLHMAKRYRI
jgi:hypothetical protein